MTDTLTKPASGQCLCGAVKFTVTLKNQNVHACHCSMCRKWGSGPFMGVDCVETPAFAEGAPIGRYSASEWGERLFCTKCGSSLVWRTRAGEHVSVSAGLIDLDRGELTSQIFIDEKPGYYDFAGDSRRMTGSEAFAAFTAGEGENT